MPKPTYYNPNQGGLLPSAAEDNGAGSLALLTLAGCAEGAIGAALSIIRSFLELLGKLLCCNLKQRYVEPFIDLK